MRLRLVNACNARGLRLELSDALPLLQIANEVGYLAAPAVVAGPAATLRTFGLDGGMIGRHFTINGRSFDPGRVDLVVPTDAVEDWRFTNRTAVPHPMHVHGVTMSLRSQEAAAAHERGLRDTFVVAPMQVLDVAVRTPPARTEVPLACTATTSNTKTPG